jgi:hypothetical protein
VTSPNNREFSVVESRLCILLVRLLQVFAGTEPV